MAVALCMSALAVSLCMSEPAGSQVGARRRGGAHTCGTVASVRFSKVTGGVPGAGNLVVTRKPLGSLSSSIIPAAPELTHF